MATMECPRKHGVTVDVESSKLDHPPGGAGKGSIGWTLSASMAVCILLLGCVLSSGSAYSTVGISTKAIQIYVIILILSTTAWMLFEIIHTRKDHFYTWDEHAGPLWLRIGLVLFGILSLIMDVFKVVSYAGYIHCESAVKIVFPVVQFVFIVVQITFFMRRAKDCAQIQTCITRFALMFVLATNLVVWMLAVSEESVHYTIVHDSSDEHARSLNYTGRSMYMMRASYGEDKCKCSHTECAIFKKAYYYLYPFNIEYSLFAAAMAFVMWSNVGRKVDPHHQHHAHKFIVKDVFLGIIKNAGLGSILGVTLWAAGLATFIKYEADVMTGLQDRIDHGLMMHLVMNIVIVTTMSLSTVAGCVAYTLDQQGHATDKNPSRSLDVALLMGAALGQMLFCFYTIVAMIAIRAHTSLDGLNLALAILTVTQLVLQNAFLAKGLHREPVQAKNWTRRLLKEVCVYLLLGNVILWIQPAFGARPQFDQSSETNFYGATMWTAVVNAGLPFGIFYRMHSVECLFEVYLNS